MHRLVEQAWEALAQGRPVVLATVTARQGSAPRAVGARMLIPAEAPPLGTIGGGLLEGRAIEASRRLLAAGRSAWLHVDLTHEDVAAMDMICGGSVDILLDCLNPGPEQVALFDHWRRLLAARAHGRFVTVVQGACPAIEGIDHFLILPDGSLQGACPLSPADLDRLREASAPSPDLHVMTLGDATVLWEQPSPAVTALFCGAGHVAQASAALAARVDFRVEVLDDRREFANAARFPTAHAVHVIPDFGQALAVCPADTGTFVVILTRGHLHDRTVLAQALRSPAAYIGMIGSRRKRAAIFADLLREGFLDSDLARVHAPIGVDIGAETPEELAVSIVAELIQARARNSS
jgi:xanthine dehydrogenase accessory factor